MSIIISSLNTINKGRTVKAANSNSHIGLICGSINGNTQSVVLSLNNSIIFFVITISFFENFSKEKTSISLFDGKTAETYFYNLNYKNFGRNKNISIHKKDCLNTLLNKFNSNLTAPESQYSSGKTTN
ncbi:MAG: hypothetical protein V4572_02255 [Bacteroidota bacterium]